MDKHEWDIEKKRKISALRQEYVAKGLVLPFEAPAAARTEAPKVSESQIHNMIGEQLAGYTSLHDSLVVQRSLVILLKRKKNGMSFGPSMVAGFLLYIFALKSYLVRLSLLWKTNAFTAVQPTSTTNSGRASKQLQSAD